MGMFKQAYYQVAFTPEGSPPTFFAPDVTLEEVKRYCGPDNPPCYVSSVSYGRCLIFFISSQKTSLEVQAALKAAWQAAVSGNAQLDATYKQTLEVSEVRCLIVGGRSGSAGDAIGDPANRLISWIQAQLRISDTFLLRQSNTP